MKASSVLELVIGIVNRTRTKMQKAMGNREEKAEVLIFNKVFFCFELVRYLLKVAHLLISS